MAGQEFDLEAIVREVLRRLQQLGGEPAASEPTREAAEAEQRIPPAPPVAPRNRPPEQLSLAQHTITLGLIQGRLQGIKEVLVTAGAVVTPSVRDELRKRQIPLRVQTEATGASPVPARVVLGVAGPTTVTAAAMAAIQAEAAGAERIDRDCVLELVRQVTQAVLGDDRIGLILTAHPAVALCLANRQTHIRGAWGVSAAAVREADRLIGANLLVVNPVQHSLYELRTMIREFVGGQHACPATYRPALGGAS